LFVFALFNLQGAVFAALPVFAVHRTAYAFYHSFSILSRTFFKFFDFFSSFFRLQRLSPKR